MPASIPELMWASRPPGRVLDENREDRALADLGERQDVDRGVLLRVRNALVDLGRHQPLARHDLAVLAMEADFGPPSATMTYRHMPPTRRSISQTIIAPRFACHQRFTNSGVVHALHTRCFGASNSA